MTYLPQLSGQFGKVLFPFLSEAPQMVEGFDPVAAAGMKLLYNMS